MNAKSKIRRTSSPSRHCACKGILLQGLIPALETTPETKLVAKSLHRLASSSMPGCPGTPLPPVNWAAIAVAVEETAAKIFREGLKDWSLPADDGAQPFDGDDLLEILKEEGLLKKMAINTVAGIEQLWKMLLQGKAPQQSIIVN